MVNDSAMQDSQDPFDPGASSSTPSFKERTEKQRNLNKIRNKRRHMDHIKIYNITDPDRTPSDTLDDDIYYPTHV